MKLHKFDLLILWFREHLTISGYRPQTIKSYVHGISLFRRWVDEDTTLADCDDLTPQHLNTYILGLYERSLSPTTIHTKIAILKCFFTACYEKNKLYKNPSSSVVSPRIGRSLPRGVLTEDETEIAFQWLEKNTSFDRVPSFSDAVAIRDHLIWELLYSCGLRNSELCSLTMDSINYREGLVTVRNGKGGHDRIIPIGSHALDMALRYIQNARPLLAQSHSSYYLLLSRRGDKIGADALRRAVNRTLASADISKKIRVHDLRHTCATHMLNSGADIRFVQEHLGHKSLSSTQVYTHISINRLKQSHTNHHPRERWTDD